MAGEVRVQLTEQIREGFAGPGRVPVHASASGKMILSQLNPAQRRKLLAHAPLQQHTPHTITDLDKLESALEQVREAGYAIDDEEFLPGLVCAAVLVPNPTGRSNLCVAVQGPVQLTIEWSASPPVVRLAPGVYAIAPVEHDPPTASAPRDVVLPLAGVMCVFIYFLFDQLLAIPWPPSMLGDFVPSLKGVIPSV